MTAAHTPRVQSEGSEPETPNHHLVIEPIDPAFDLELVPAEKRWISRSLRGGDTSQLVPPGPASFERLALPVAVRKRMGIIAMKVFGQEHLVGAATPEQLLSYALSLPVSLASVGMPKPELITQNVALATHFSPLSRRERNRLVKSITAVRQHAMHRFFRDHEDA